MRLIVEPAASAPASFALGPFTVAWHPAHGLQVTHAAHPGHLLWASVPGAAFVEVASGVARAHETRGHLRVVERTLARCTAQTVAALVPSGLSLRVTGSLRWRGGSVGYTLTLAPCNAEELGFALTLDDPRFNRTALVYASEPDEAFFGFGVQYSHVDMKGRRLPVVVTEQGVGRGAQPITLAAELRAGAGGSWHSSYAPVPHYITSRARSLYLETYAYTVFDLRRPDRARVELFAHRMQGRIVAGATPADLIRVYTARSGRMRPLPTWITGGAVVGLQGGTALVRERWRQLRASGAPLAGLWLQDWVGRRATSFGAQLWWNWQLDAAHYPGWEALRAEIEHDGARLLIYVNPMLVDTADRPGRNLYAEAVAQGLLVRDATGAPLRLLQTDFHAGLVDLTNPTAWAFLKAAIGAALDATGASGWMADYAEGLPMEALLHDGSSGWASHNRYPELWARLNAELAAERAEREPVFFLRSAYRESPRHAPLFWLGDQLTSWDAHDGIKSAVTGLLSGGFSGFSVSHGDAGGYTTITDPPLRYRRGRELLWRWLELCALTAVLRTHEGSRPWANQQIYGDERNRAHFARCAQLYAAWGFYREQLLAEAAATGLPVVRHPAIVFPAEPALRRVTHEQFMLGDELLVAPALRRGARAVRVLLPPGRWELLWSGAIFTAQGRPVRIPAPLGAPPVLFRPGSAVGARLREELRARGVL